MEELKELINLINKNKIKRIEILGNPTNYASNMQRLYDGIARGEFSEEEEASNFFYEGSENKGLYFTRLKRNLHKRLINTIFFIDVNQPNYIESQKAYYNCYKDFAAMKILMGRGGRKTAISMGEKILRQAIRHEFTNLIVDLARELRHHYGSILGNRKKFAEYNAILKENLEKLRAEMLAEEYYIDLATNFAASAATKFEIAETAKEYAEELEQYIDTQDSYRFNFMAYNVFALRYQIINDYKNTLIVCEKAVALFESKKVAAAKTAIFTFLFKMLTCYIQLKDYKQGEIAAKRCLELRNEGRLNWFLTMNNYLILSYHSNQLQRAFEVYLMATQHPNFKNLFKNYREEWLIHEAFINYFISIKKIKVGMHAANQFKKFRVSKFLNEVPTYSKDKRGNNITILIIQILFLLQQKKYDVVIDRMEALNVYCHRYLRKDDTYRSNCFIKMLMTLPQAHFNKTAAERKTKKIRSRLEDVPLEAAKQSSELEIVPYEMLWEYVLESLDNKFHHV